jgi:hypothetical protein
MQRLAEHGETIKNVEFALRELESRPAPDYDLVDIDAQTAVDAITGVIRACPDPKQLRMLLSTFVEKITLTNSTAVVEYREDALLRSPTPTVHSGVRWLLDLGSNQGPTD